MVPSQWIDSVSSPLGQLVRMSGCERERKEQSKHDSFGNCELVFYVQLKTNVCHILTPSFFRVAVGLLLLLPFNGDFPSLHVLILS